MTWHLDRIPKIMFGFWGTEDFPFIRWLTLKTFRIHHPDWRILLYKKPILDKIPAVVDPKKAEELSKYVGYEDLVKATFSYNNPNYWSRLEELKVEVVDIDVEEEIGRKFPVPYITCFADVMRYVVLTKKHGGLYVDLDNLFFKSLENAPFNNPNNSSKDTFILPPPYHHWVLSVQNSAWCQKVLSHQINNLPQNSSKFLDTTAITERVPKNNADKVLYLPMNTTEENFNQNGPVADSAICLNWHGSGVYGKYSAVTEDNYKTSDHPLAACVRYCLDGQMGNTNNIGTFKWIERGG